MTLEIPGYKILSTLGKGGMATVYLAEHELFRRKVALKVMAHGLTDDSTFGERFMREARIVSQLVHPNIVTVYDVGVHEGNYYLSMEFIDGKDLKHARSHLPLQQKISIILDIAKALEYAGNKGYVHRDIKPENIMLYTEDSRAVLTDFGIARAAEQEISVTQTGTAIGTPHYMSPEQAKGQPVDIRSDIYGLGVVFYLLLAGCVPFDAESAVAIGIKHITEPIPELPEGLESLQHIIDRMLAKLPQQRYQSPVQLIQDLQHLDIPAIAATAEQASARANASLHNASADAPTVISPVAAKARSTRTRSMQTKSTQPTPGNKRTKTAGRNNDPTPYLVEEPFELEDEEEDNVIWPWLAGVFVLLAVVGGVYYSQHSVEIDGWLADRRAQWEGSSEQRATSDTIPGPSVEDDEVLTTDIGSPVPTSDPNSLPDSSPANSLNPESDTEVSAAPNSRVIELRQRIQEMNAQLDTDASQLAPLLAAWRELQLLLPDSTEADAGIAKLLSDEIARIKQLAVSGNREAGNGEAGNSEAASARLGQLRDLAFELPAEDLVEVDTLIAQQGQIEQWLQEGQAFLAEDTLTRPVGDNARARFEQVLALRPDSQRAQQGLSDISARLTELAGNAFNANQLDRASGLLARSIEIDPGNQKALALQESVTQAAATQANQQREALLQQVETKLQQAETKLQEAAYFQPPEQSAYHYFSQVLGLQPNNTAARNGVTRTIEEFEKRLLNLVAEEHIQVVRDRLQTAKTRVPNDERLISLEQRVEDAIVATQPRVVDVLVTGVATGELIDEQPAIIQADRSISVSFHYENFDAETSVIQAILMDGARSVRIAQVPVIIMGTEGAKTFKIDRPVERFSAGSYTVDLYFKENRLATHTFQVE